ncbi:MAG: hypothetical protein IPN69_08235 [Acidobacteria bacterium]|nr:hypothetical protein [Acidobacteriota bacterium]
MGYGLKGNVRQIVESLNRQRALRGDCNLSTYIADKYKDADGNPLSVNHLYAELDVDPRRTTVDQLYADPDSAALMTEIIRDGVRRGMGIAQRESLQRIRTAALAGTYDAGRERFMSREVFLDPVMRGAVQSTFYPDLVIREETVSQPTVTMPQIEIADALMKDSAEAATIEEGLVTYGSKDVKLTKKARGFKITYEAIRYNSLSLAQIFFEDAGRILGHTLNGMAVETIINGDQADTSESADVIGVENTANKVTWYDLARVAIQLSLLGRTGSQIIGNATSALNFLNLTEVKNKQFPGAPLLATMLKTPLTMPETLFVSPKVTGDKVIIQDPSASMIQLTSAPLLVETEKIISKQIEAAYVSITTGFAKIQRNASIVVDGAVAFSGSGFDTWMQPYS